MQIPALKFLFVNMEINVSQNQNKPLLVVSLK